MNAAAPSASLAGLEIVKRLKGAAPVAKQGDLTRRLAAPPAPPPPAPAPAAAPLPLSRKEEPPPRAEEIVLYWERLRRGRAFPAPSEIDRGLVGRAWPESLIVSFDGDDAAMPHIARLGANDGAIEYTPMVTDWILTRARQAARRGARGDEVRSFYVDGGEPRYRLFLLPLSMHGGASDSVLCHLCAVA